MRYLILFLLLSACASDKKQDTFNPREYTVHSFCGGYVVVREYGSKVTEEDIAKDQKECEEKGQCLAYVFGYSDGNIKHSCRMKESYVDNFKASGPDGSVR